MCFLVVTAKLMRPVVTAKLMCSLVVTATLMRPVITAKLMCPLVVTINLMRPVVTAKLMCPLVVTDKLMCALVVTWTPNYLFALCDIGSLLAEYLQIRHSDIVECSEMYVCQSLSGLCRLKNKFSCFLVF